MVYLPAVEEGHVLDEDGSGPQDEGHEEMHVDVVSGTVQLPEQAQDSHGNQEAGKGQAVADGVAGLHGIVELGLLLLIQTRCPVIQAAGNVVGAWFQL